MSAMLKRPRPWLMDLMVILLPGLLYWRTLAPTVFAVDSVEFTTGAYTLGLVHPPGYPTYLLLGRLFLSLPVGDFGYRLNLMSAVFGVLSCWVAYRILLTVGVRPLFAGLAALLRALSFYIWSQAVVAEVYSLHWFLVLLIFWGVLRWRQGGGRGWLYAAALAAGLSLTNHITSVLVFPGLAYLLFAPGPPGQDRPRLMVRDWLICAGCGVAGLLPYLYLPLRYMAEPGLDYARKYLAVDLTTWDGVIWYTTGGPFRDMLLTGSLVYRLRESLLFVQYLLYNSLVVGLILAGLGAWLLMRRDRPLFWASFCGFALTALFFINYNVFDKFSMYGVALWIMALWIGLGLEWLAAQDLPTWVTPGLAGALLLAQVIVFFPQADVSQAYDVRVRGEAVMAELPAEAIYFGTWETVMVMEYLQIVEQSRPDLTIINLPFSAPEVVLANVSAFKATVRPICFSPSLVQSLEKNGAVVTEIRFKNCVILRRPADFQVPLDLLPYLPQDLRSSK